MKRIPLWISCAVLLAAATAILGCSSAELGSSLGLANRKAGSASRSISATYGKPLFTMRNSSDPQIRYFTGTAFGFSYSNHYLYTSCDIDKTQNPAVADLLYPMNATYCYYSPDGVNWYDQGAVMTEDQIPVAKHDAYELWAPDVFQGPNGMYFYIAPVEPGNASHPYDKSIAGASATFPTGPFTPQRTLVNAPNETVYDRTSDTFYTINYASDPSVCQNQLGDYYMVFCDGDYSNTTPQGRISISALNATALKAGIIQAGAASRLSINGAPDTYMEGPSLVYANYGGGSYFYLIVAYYDPSVGKEDLGYAYSKNILGPYTWAGNNPLMTANADEWTIQGSMIQWNNEWVLFYHDHDRAGEPSGTDRHVCSELIAFNSDGTIANTPIQRTADGTGPLE